MRHPVEVLPATLLEEMRADLIHAATDTIGETLAYARDCHLDMPMTNAHVGLLAVVPCRFHRSRFEFDQTGEPAAVIELFGADDESVIDLVAWPTVRPERFVTAIGNAWACGMARVAHRVTCPGAKPLLLYRTPLRWLQAGCQGGVVLQPRHAPEWLPDVPQIAAEDPEHAEWLAGLLRGHVHRSRIMFPRSTLGTAA